MKKTGMIALVLILTLSLAACGGRNNNDANTPMSTQSETNATVIPDIIPSMETNIPDPNVDTSMPMYTDGTTGTDGMTTNGTTGPNR